jgi:hypothetical protein
MKKIKNRFLKFELFRFHSAFRILHSAIGGFDAFL